MIYIAHRINTIAELGLVPVEYGVEIDVRAEGNQLILAHDPFVKGELLASFLKHYQHNLLIINVKCEGIEYEIMDLLEKYNISNYFFLDSSFPMITKMLANGISKIAIRFSEFESIETLAHFKNKIEWAWIDCFTHMPLTKVNLDLLQTWGYKTCIVSPDLVGRPHEIPTFATQLKSLNYNSNAICSKINNIAKWKDELK